MPQAGRSSSSSTSADGTLQPVLPNDLEMCQWQTVALQQPAWQTTRRVRRPAKQPVEQAPQQLAQQTAQQAVQPTAKQPSSIPTQRAVLQSVQQTVSLQGTDLTKQQVVDLLQPKLAGFGYMYVGSTAALLQGVQVPDCYKEVQVCVQWDNLQALQQKLCAQKLQPTPVTQHGPGQLGFTLQLQGVTVLCFGHQNTVVRMDPERVQITDASNGRQYWCESLLSVRRGAQADLAAAVDARLQQLQAKLTASNAEVGTRGHLIMGASSI